MCNRLQLEPKQKTLSLLKSQKITAINSNFIHYKIGRITTTQPFFFFFETTQQPNLVAQVAKKKPLDFTGSIAQVTQLNGRTNLSIGSSDCVK